MPGNMSRLTDEELLNVIDHVAHHSPIISELVKRLKVRAQTIDTGHLSDKVECPVCMAGLKVVIDQANDMFTIKIDNT